MRTHTMAAAAALTLCLLAATAAATRSGGQSSSPPAPAPAPSAHVDGDISSCLLANGVTNFSLPSSPSYTPLLDSSIRNYRFEAPSVGKPAAVVFPSSKRELRRAVLCARASALAVRVRSGGHSYEGLSYTTQNHVPFAVIDLARLSRVRVDAGAATAWAEAGATLGEVYSAVARANRTLAFSAGSCATVGMGGHAAGGGFGLLSRKFGLAADNVLDAVLIAPGGETLTRGTMDEDVFWAIRGGGGGSWGVVYAWKLRLVPVPENVTVFSVDRSGPVEAIAGLMHRWQHVGPSLPDEFYLSTFIPTASGGGGGGGNLSMSFTGQVLGPKPLAMAVLSQTFPELGLAESELTEVSWLESVVKFAGVSSAAELTSRQPGEGEYAKRKSDYVQAAVSMEDALRILQYLSTGPEGSSIQLDPYGGAMARVASSETPFPHRAGYLYSIQYAVTWTASETTERADEYMAWLRSFYAFMATYVSKNPRAAYVNYLDLDLGTNDWTNATGGTSSNSVAHAASWGERYFSTNFDRLVRAKTKVDPGNVFNNAQTAATGAGAAPPPQPAQDDISSCLQSNGVKNFSLPGSPSYTPLLDSSIRYLRFRHANIRKPAAVVLPSSKQELQRAVLCARNSSLTIRVRSGGHSYEGLSYTTENDVAFVVIDLANLNRVRVDLSSATVWAEAGATTGELYHAIGQSTRSLAFPGATCSTIGLGGLISGGGFGLLSRKFGLAADNVLDAELIDATGAALTRASMHEDVFWAIRGGGGGSFGVVYSWTLRLVPVPDKITVLSIDRTGPADRVAALIHRWQLVAPHLPDEFYLSTRIYFPGELNVTFTGQVLGPKNLALSVLNQAFPELRLAESELSEVSWVESAAKFAELGSVADLANRRLGEFEYAKRKSDYARSPVPLEDVAKIAAYMLAAPTNGSVQLNPYGGAMARIASTDTPFPHRAGYLYSVQYAVEWTAADDAARGDEYMRWLREFYEFMAPHVCEDPRGAYVNYVDLDLGTNNWTRPSGGASRNAVEHAASWGQMYFLDNYGRLVRAKSRIDPGNVFNNAQSIPPFARCAAAAAADAAAHQNDLSSCLVTHGVTNFSLPTSPSYAALLNSSIRNLRFALPDVTKPAAVVLPSSQADLRAAVLCARAASLAVRVRSGGHSYEGLSYTTEHRVPFAVIDLARLSRVAVDRAVATAWAEAGATLGELYYAVGTSSRALAFPGGSCSTIGLGGIVSGGGFGLLSRKFGLAADNVLDAVLIDAGGRVLDRSAMGEDVFWAIRGGGGGSWGVVYAWKLRLVPVPRDVTVFGVDRTGPVDYVAGLVHRWQLVAPALPDEFYLSVYLPTGGSSDDGNVSASFSGQVLAPKRDAFSALRQRFPELELAEANLAETSWLDATAQFAGLDAAADLPDRRLGSKEYSKGKSDYVQAPIPRRVVADILRRLSTGPEQGYVILDPYGGAMARAARGATPFPHRAGTLYGVQYQVYWDALDQGAGEERVAWLRALHAFMSPHVSRAPRGAYVNYLDLDLGADGWTAPAGGSSDAAVARARVSWGAAYFGDNFDRLVRAKTAIDPGNVFNNAQSIPPLPLMNFDVISLGRDAGRPNSTFEPVLFGS
ncbi:hypothetical protein U9M48_040808 [Paspalum notatum var. saurae]|uniref:FAD-binding PCMH-type domain-containing protein n=1 Tax=Paspalum notatum var. saurae TaxID=547442 RepID=A0AAQ3XDL7_PASNO